MRQDLLGFILLFLKSELAIIYFHAIDYTLLQTFLIVTGCTSLVIFWLYYLAGVFDRFVVKRMHIGNMLQEVYLIKNIRRSLKRGEKRLLAWFLKHNRKIIIIVFVLPFIPFIEPVAVVASKIQKIKGALPLILLANVLKIYIVTFVVYH